MPDFIDQLHFIRPYWLYALVPVLILYWGLYKWQRSDKQWQRWVDNTLLAVLRLKQHKTTSKWTSALLPCAWSIAIIALAGPAWQKIPQPLYMKEDALVVVFHLGISAYADDIRPSRLVRAKHKIRDLLALRQEGLTAMVVYAGSAHTVTPLSDDTATILSMLDVLQPSLMPTRGNDLVAAIEKTVLLLDNAAIPAHNSSVLLLSDSIPPAAIEPVSTMLRERGARLSVIGIGTEEGAPVKDPNGGFVKDASGAIKIARLDRSSLSQLAISNNGHYADIELDDSDLLKLLPSLQKSLLGNHQREQDRTLELWQEGGFWLILPLIPLIGMGFRQSRLLLCLFLLPFLMIEKTWATNKNPEWDNLFLNEQQQAVAQVERGIKEYRTQDYAAAATYFSDGTSPEAHYNYGNALAHLGKYEDAIAAYDRALALQKDMEDAIFNKNLLQSLLNQDEQSAQNEPQQGDDKQQSAQNEPQQGDDKQQSAQNEPQQGDDKQQSAQNEPQQGDDKQQSAQNEPQDSNTDSTVDPLSTQLNAEKSQALEQWLLRIPDNPGELLKRKFLYQYHREQDKS